MDQLERLQNIDRSQNIDGWHIRAYFWSRSGRLLSLIALLILAIAAGGAWLWRETNSEKSHVAMLREELKKSAPDSGRVFELLATASRRDVFVLTDDPDGAGPAGWIRHSALGANDKALALAYCESLAQNDGEPSADLIWLAHQQQPVPRANELIGDLHLGKLNDEKARRYLEREVQRPAAGEARAKLLALLLEKRDYAALDARLADPAYAKEARPEFALALAAAQRRWTSMFQPLAALEK